MMLQSCILLNILLLIFLIANSTSSSSDLPNINCNLKVPHIQSNASFNATKSTPSALIFNTDSMNITQKEPKVPLRRNVSESNITTAFTWNVNPTSTNGIFANVLQLARNVDARMRNIRNVEMRVATIQEIFDSMHFASSSISSINIHKNYTDVLQKRSTTLAAITHSLNFFCERLSRKLVKATHTVLELRDFFRQNITKCLLQERFLQKEYKAQAIDKENDEEDEDSEDTEVDIEIDYFENKRDTSVFLRTYIQACQDNNDSSIASRLENSVKSTTELNYNKQQIQILNYLKNEHNYYITNPYENGDNANSVYHGRYMEINAYIEQKMQALKHKLAKSTDPTDFPNTNLKNNSATTNMSSNTKLNIMENHIRHIYFLSRSDQAGDHTTSFHNNLRFRRLFVSAIKYKYVFLLIDIGSAMTTDLMDLTKSFVNNILQLLSDDDFISIITIADVAKSMYIDMFPNDAANGLYLATRERKDEIMNYVNNLAIVNSLTNHSKGFEFAFDMLKRVQQSHLITPNNPIDCVYLTRGLLTNLSDATYVLNVIAKGQRTLFRPVGINTIAVVLDEKRIMYERQFLTDIATQNYTKYDIKINDSLNSQLHGELIGKFYVLTKMHADTILKTSTAIFCNIFEDQYLAKSFDLHTPVVDENSKESIVSITHAAFPYGVIGVDLYLADLIEDVASFQQQDQINNRNEFVYAFLIDMNGITITHPAFPRPTTQTETPFPVDIVFLENSTDFANIRHRMLQEEFGNATTTIQLSSDGKNLEMSRTYFWKGVLHLYVICIVSTTKKENIKTTNINITEHEMKNNGQTAPKLSMPIFSTHDTMIQYSAQHTIDNYEYTRASDLLYHRLDLLPVSQHIHICRYFRQIATFDAATLFLSEFAFESPFTFLHNSRMNSKDAQIRTVESIMAYLKDSTGLLANPGLRPPIRDEVNALYNAMQHLKKRHQDSRGTMQNYIIRRYIATVNGVLQVYPGCLMKNNYDPSRRPWFHKAMQHAGKIITTAPYLDSGGAGYIITIAHTIFEGKANALHSLERDEPVAIVAIDLPYTYYYKMLQDSTPICQQLNMKCLLFENEGYLVAHPSMLEVSSAHKNQRRPHEHLTHKEPYLTNDILYHKRLVNKLACANYQNRVLQRYYVFNTSLEKSEIFTNVVAGERTKYAITLIKGSNIFATVLNSSSDGGAFCPCSTIDRMCLNCNRMDQMDCECPCECPMEADVFSSNFGNEPFSNYTHQFAYCKPPSENFLSISSTPIMGSHTFLHSCGNINCDIYGTQHECLAVKGCEWCQQDLDGNGFSAAFCTSQSTCFNGVLSALTPYGDLNDVDILTAHSYNPGQKPNSYSAFGPVGGAIVVLGIVIGFAIYCYRHNLDSHSQDQFYVDSMQEENYGLPLSRFNFDEAQDDPPGTGCYDHPLGQRHLMQAAEISPYHMSSGSSYRRPPNGESDHGYSTMTPHEDSSEHQCFTLAEPLLLNDKHHSKSDTMSISTSISSPTNPNRNQKQQQPFQAASVAQQPTSTTCTNTYNVLTPRKLHHPSTSTVSSPMRDYKQTKLSLDDDNESSTQNSHFILAPVTVHRHMETSES